MKKTLCSLLALATGVLVLNSCTKTDKIEIVWWNDYAQPTEKNPTGDFSRYEYVEGVIEDYEALHPNVKIVQQAYDDYDKIAEQVRNGLSSHVLPNIASVYPDDAVTFGDAVLHASKYFDDAEVGFGKTVDASGKIIDDEKSLKSDIDFNSEKTSYGDEKDFLTLPYSRSTEGLFINDSVFEKVGEGAAGHTASEDPALNGGEQYIAPVAASSKAAYEVPTDWTEMIDLARQMMVDFPDTFSEENRYDEDGNFKAVPICYDSADNLFISLCKMMNIDYTSLTAPTFNNDDVKNMLIQLKKWNNEGLICTKNQLTWSKTSPEYHAYSTSMVNYGSVFMLISSSTSGMYLFADGYKASVHPTPTAGKKDFPIFNSIDAGTHQAIAQGPSLVLFRNAKTEVEKYTFDFYKFLTNTDNSAGLAATTGYFPIRQSSNSTPAVQNLIKAADNEVSETSTTAETQQAKKDTYLGQSYKLNQEYLTEGCYFSAPVFDNKTGSSAGCRDAVGALVNTILNDHSAKTDEQIKTLVDQAVASAFSQAANS